MKAQITRSILGFAYLLLHITSADTPSFASEAQIQEYLSICRTSMGKDYYTSRDRLLNVIDANPEYLAKLHSQFNDKPDLTLGIVCIHVYHKDKARRFREWLNEVIVNDVRIGLIEIGKDGTKKEVAANTDKNPLALVRGEGLSGLLFCEYGSSKLQSAIDFASLKMSGYQNTQFNELKISRLGCGREAYFLLSEILFKDNVVFDEAAFAFAMALVGAMDVSSTEKTSPEGLIEWNRFVAAMSGELASNISSKIEWEKTISLLAMSYYYRDHEDICNKAINDALVDKCESIRIAALLNIRLLKSDNEKSITNAFARWWSVENNVSLRRQGPTYIYKLSVMHMSKSSARDLLGRMVKEDADQDVKDSANRYYKMIAEQMK